MSQQGILRRLRKAQDRVRAEIRGHASRDGKYATGLAPEGYSGGYEQALMDVELILRGIEPNDRRGYWRIEE